MTTTQRSRRSVCPQRSHRIDARSTVRRNPACAGRDDHEHSQYDDQRKRIVRDSAVREGARDLRDGESSAETEGHTDQRRSEPVLHREPKHVFGGGSKRDPDADFVLTFRDLVADHGSKPDGANTNAITLNAASSAMC